MVANSPFHPLVPFYVFKFIMASKSYFEEENLMSDQYSSGRSECTDISSDKSVPVFDGDYTKFIPFWDIFKGRVHQNSELSAFDKLMHLRKVLAGEPADLIAMLTDYTTAVRLLKSHYKKKDTMINIHVLKILHLAPAKDISNVYNVKRLRDELKINLIWLERLGIERVQYDRILFPIVAEKLPLYIVKQHYHGERSRHVNELIRVLDETIEMWDEVNDVNGILPKNFDRAKNIARDRGDRPLDRPEPEEVRKSYCVLCGILGHSLIDCVVPRTYEEKIDILRRLNRCLNCSGKHKSMQCQNECIPVCRLCRGNHLTILCRRYGASRQISNN